MAFQKETFFTLLPVSVLFSSTPCPVFFFFISISLLTNFSSGVSNALKALLC